MIRIAPHTYTIEETDPPLVPIPENAECSVVIDHKLAFLDKQYDNNATYVQAPPNSTLYFYTPKQGHTGEAYSPTPELSIQQCALHHQKHTVQKLEIRKQSDMQNATLAQRASTAWKTHVFANSPSTRLLPLKNTELATIQSNAITKGTPTALQMRIASPNGVTLKQTKRIALAWDEEGRFEGNGVMARYSALTRELVATWRFSLEELGNMQEWEGRYNGLVYYVGYGSIVGKGGVVEVTAWSEGIGFGINKMPGKVMVLSMGV